MSETTWTPEAPITARERRQRAKNWRALWPEVAKNRNRHFCRVFEAELRRVDDPLIAWLRAFDAAYRSKP